MYAFNDNQSDSGEDFDYGDEEDESETGQANNIDLMEYISNLDVSGFQGQNNANANIQKKQDSVK